MELIREQVSSLDSLVHHLPEAFSAATREHGHGRYQAVQQLGVF